MSEFRSSLQRAVERIHRRAIGAKRDVHGRARLSALGEPEVRDARRLETDVLALLHEDGVAQRLERSQVERLRCREVANVESDVVEHLLPPRSGSGAYPRCPARLELGENSPRPLRRDAIAFLLSTSITCSCPGTPASTSRTWQSSARCRSWRPGSRRCTSCQRPSRR